MQNVCRAAFQSLIGFQKTYSSCHSNWLTKFCLIHVANRAEYLAQSRDLQSNAAKCILCVCVCVCACACVCVFLKGSLDLVIDISLSPYVVWTSHAVRGHCSIWLHMSMVLPRGMSQLLCFTVCVGVSESFLTHHCHGQ